MALVDSYVKKQFTRGDELEEERKAALLDEMGITTRDVNKLRAMMLSAEEAVCAKSEELEHIRQHKSRKENWDEFVDVKRRMGMVLHHSEVVRKLRAIIPGLVVAPGGQRGCISLYVTRNLPTSEITGYAGTRQRLDVPIYVSWLPEGWVPEYEIDYVNDVNVAVGQKRSWRTVLLRMISRKDAIGRPTSLITELQAEKEFGYPSNGATASWYRGALFEFRNGSRRVNGQGTS